MKQIKSAIRKFLMILVYLVFGIASMAQLPAVILKDIKGKEVNTSTLGNNGKPFILIFFATWCKPCIRELSAINEVYENWQEETGVKLIAVSIDEAQNVNKVKPLVDGFSWDYEVLLDPNGTFKRLLNIDLIPAVFIVNGNGKIVESHSGYTEGSEKQLIEKVRELVNL